MKEETTMIKVTKSTRRAIKMAAVDNNMTMSEFIDSLIVNYELRKLMEEDCDD